MKRFLSLVAFLSLSLVLSVQAQDFQPLNAGFEDWDDPAVDAEPLRWNSFATSDGPLASMANTPHHYHRFGGRPGTDGTSFLTIYSKSILGIVVANGNMTTGRIHAGSMEPASDDNHNYTQRSNPEFSQPFTATPDSMYVWVSYYAASPSSQASVSVVVHGNNDFRDPADINNAGMYHSKALATCTRTTTSPNAYGWTQLKVPFVHNGTAPAEYLLISLSTNAVQGEGSVNDSLSIDDIQFVYSAWLSDIQVNGSPVPEFRKDRFSYHIKFATPEAMRAAFVSCATEVDDAVVQMVFAESDSVKEYTIHTTAEDGVTSLLYQVTLYVEGALGIDEGQKHRVNVFPNPASSKLSVEGCDMRHLSLVASDGRTLLRKQMPAPSQSCTIDVGDVPAGNYILVVDGVATPVVVSH